VGVPIQKENEAHLGPPPETRGEENRDEVFPSHPTGGSGERRELSQRGLGQSYGRKNGFIVI